MRGLAGVLARTTAAGRLRFVVGAALGCLVLGLLAAAPANAAPTWLAPDDLSATGQNAESPQVALDSQGDAVAVWRRYDGANYIVQAATRPAGGAWQEPDDLSEAGQNAENPQVAVDSQGDAVAVWRRYDGANYIVQAATRPTGGAWQEPDDLSATGQNAENPQVAVDSQGDAVAVWRRYDGANYIVQAAGYDAAGPELRSFSVPPTGVAGQPVAFSVSPFDIWSSLGATSWSFGDGGVALGAAVSHTYASAGTYTVGVTGSDALGNTTSASGAIAIEPAPQGAKPAPKGGASTSGGTMVAAGRALVKRGRALLRARCRGGGRCQGVVKLIAVVRAHRIVKRKNRKRVRRVLIGRARFGISAGKTKMLGVRLNRRGRRMLRRASRHRLKVRLTGNGVKRRAVMLKEARRKRR
jgi:hypothetical protein